MKQQNITRNALVCIHERILQQRVHAFFSSGNIRLTTNSGTSIHILNPGRINHRPGPDFLAMAIRIDGELYVGNGEFHKRTSDWFAHRHHLDSQYADLLLHIVCINDIDIAIAKETIIISEQDIIHVRIDKCDDTLNNLDDLQDYAFHRLMRRCNEVKHGWEALSEPLTFLEHICEQYLVRRQELRPRTIVRHSNMLIQQFISSPLVYHAINYASLPIDIRKSTIQERHGIKPHEFFELYLNCLFPMLMVMHEHAHEGLLAWYWSQPRQTMYASLKKRFPAIPQSYMWQQQGILEFLRNEYRGGNVCGEISQTYLTSFSSIQ